MLFLGVKLMVLFNILFSVCVRSFVLVMIISEEGCKVRVIFFVVNWILCVLLSCVNSLLIVIGVRGIFCWFFSCVWCSRVFISVCICVFCVSIFFVKWVIIFVGGFLCRIFVVLCIVVSGFFSLWVNVYMYCLILFLFFSLMCIFFSVCVSLCSLLLFNVGNVSGWFLVMEFV